MESVERICGREHRSSELVIMPRVVARVEPLYNMDHLSAYKRYSLPGIPSVLTSWIMWNFLCTEFVEIHGDRKFGDDPAIVGGFGILSRNSRSA